MNVAELIAPIDSFGIPAPAWLFVFLLNLTLVLHFTAMGCVFLTTLLHVIWAGTRAGTPARWMLQRTERPLGVVLSFTITLGVAPLLFVQVLYQPVFYTANILIGYQWLGIIFMLMLGFYTIYLVSGGRTFVRVLPRPLHVAARLLIFLCVCYVGLTQTVNALVGMLPETWPTMRESGGNFLRLGTPILWPRLLHNAIGAATIGGVWMLALGARSERLETDAVALQGAAGLRKLGGMIVLLGVMLQAMTGGWLLVVESRDVLHELLGAARPASWLWLLSLVAMMGLAALGVVGMGRRPSRAIVWSAWGTLTVVLAGMFAAREAARQVHLAPYFHIGQWEVRPQLSSLALFFVMFLVALAVIGLMIRWLMVSWRRPDGAESSAAS